MLCATSKEEGIEVDKGSFVQKLKEYLPENIYDCKIGIDIRPFTVGCKNWLFSDTPTGAHASTRTYTMVEMAKAHS